MLPRPARRPPANPAAPAAQPAGDRSQPENGDLQPKPEEPEAAISARGHQ